MDSSRLRPHLFPFSSFPSSARYRHARIGGKLGKRPVKARSVPSSPSLFFPHMRQDECGEGDGAPPSLVDVLEYFRVLCEILFLFLPLLRAVLTPLPFLFSRGMDEVVAPPLGRARHTASSLCPLLRRKRREWPRVPPPLPVVNKR